MPRVGIRDLKYRASEIFRAVRDERAEYVVTNRGQAVAVILPVEESESRAAPPSPELLAALADLRARIASRWQSDKGALELLAEQRR